MLTDGKLKSNRFDSFDALAREISRADAERARNLAKTRAARQANRRNREIARKDAA